MFERNMEMLTTMQQINSTLYRMNRAPSFVVRRKEMRCPMQNGANSDFLMHYGVSGQKWGVRRYQNEDGSLTPEGKERYNDSSPESKKWNKQETSYLSDDELNRRNSRLQRERQYRDLTTTEKERDRESMKKEFKKKLITAALITPVIALVGVAGKKYAAQTAKVLGKYGKRMFNKIRSGNALRSSSAIGRSVGKYSHPNGSRGFIGSQGQRINTTRRLFNYQPNNSPLPRNRAWPRV